MAMEVMARYSLPASGRASSAHSADALRRRGAGDLVEVSIVHADGSREALALSSAAAGIIEDVLEKIAKGEQVTLLAEDAEVSPEDAAAILGISRPLVQIGRASCRERV